MRTPESRAASALPPIAYRYRPTGVCAVSHQRMNARITRYSTMIWNPPTVVCGMLFHAVEVGGTGWLFEEMITSTAARIDPMPSVAMNELTPSLTTIKALVRPIAIATTIPAMIPGPTAQWLPFMRTIVRIPDTFAVAPTDRS